MSTEAVYLGVDLGRSTRLALVDGKGDIVSNSRVPTEMASGRSLVDGLIKTLNAAKKERTILGVGVGLPGLIDRRNRQVKALPNFPDVSAIDVFGEMENAIGIPIIFDNDANMAAYGEWKRGAARGSNDFAFITMGTGIGCGLVIGGKLQRGAFGFAGEFGHMKVGSEDLECSCGSSGCLETMASGPNIVRRTREKMFADPGLSASQLSLKMNADLSCKDVVDAAIHNDELARSVLAETARYLGIAIVNVINLLNVERVVLGGPVMSAGDFLLRAIRDEVAVRCFEPVLADCSIVIGQLKGDAGVIGAALMARDSA